MPIRTIENCALIKRIGMKPDTDDGKCVGFGKSEEDDEPCEICQKCVLNNCYEK